MTEFAKAQSYAIKAAVIALAAGDVASYLVLKNNINEPVSYSENVTDLIDSENAVQSAPTGLAEMKPVMAVPTFTENAVAVEVSLPPIPAAEDAVVPVTQEPSALPEIRVRPRSIAMQASVPGVRGPTRVPVRRRAATMSFSQAFAGYPDAEAGPISPAAEDQAAAAAINLSERPTVPDSTQGLDSGDNAAAMEQSSESQESDPVPSDVSGELPALDNGQDETATEDQRSATVPTKTANRDGVNGLNFLATSEILVPHWVTGLPNFEAPFKPSVAAVNSAAIAQIEWVDAVTPQAVRFATNDLIAPPISTTEGQASDAAGRAIGPRPLQEHPVKVAQPAPHAGSGMFSIAIRTAEADQLGQYSGSNWPNGEVALCLRDIVSALRPLMSADEFVRLMRSKYSAAVISLTRLHEAGIVADYDPVSRKVVFAGRPGGELFEAQVRA